ncbi:hypothetical protein EYF80_045182 [Liparis tanakae]|uniref:Uncharacterized protein n=1 Tax=Liparis tanakae TaxID=230148 RepID=A0A4Z2FW86_9TELE|nr:hypothetical protein EYF80_045182 [Liparis tanakae]
MNNEAALPWRSADDTFDLDGADASDDGGHVVSERLLHDVSGAPSTGSINYGESSPEPEWRETETCVYKICGLPFLTQRNLGLGRFRKVTLRVQKNTESQKRRAGTCRGEGNRSSGPRMNPSGTLLGGVIPSSGLSLADSARAEELSVAEGACS